MDQLVSIIIPAYNVEKFISRCLDSLLAQTYVSKEIIVVDDGSSDGTAAICDSYERNNSCIKIIHQQNTGVSGARNRALDVSRGQYIVFVDSDDTVEPCYIEVLMRWAMFDFVTAGFHWQDMLQEWHYRQYPDEAVSIQALRETPSAYLGKYYFGAPWAKLYKREIIENNRLRFDSTIHSGEDTLFILNYLQHVKNVRIIPDCGYNYFYYKTSLVHQVHNNYWQWKIRVEREMEQFFDPLKQQEEEFLQNRFFEVLQDLIRKYKSEWNREKLFGLYKNPFFCKCIQMKQSTGANDERFFIFCMEHKNYTLYEWFCKSHSLIFRVKRRIKRIVVKK